MASLKVSSVLRALGDDIRTARKKRRIPVAEFASRIGVSEGTLARLEKGDGGVRIETLAMALLVLGELGRLERLIDPASDDAGLMLENERLPERIDRSRARTVSNARLPQTGDPEGEVF